MPLTRSGSSCRDRLQRSIIVSYHHLQQQQAFFGIATFLRRPYLVSDSNYCTATILTPLPPATSIETTKPPSAKKGPIGLVGSLRRSLVGYPSRSAHRQARRISASVSPHWPLAHPTTRTMTTQSHTPPKIDDPSASPSSDAEDTLPPLPIVAVIGTTGVGKSDFAVDLALAFEKGQLTRARPRGLSGGSSRGAGAGGEGQQGSMSGVGNAIDQPTTISNDASADHHTRILGQDQLRRQTPPPTNGDSTSLPVARPKALVLSADSMQLYKGLPLITNQLTLEEMRGVEHWGVGVVEPLRSRGAACAETSESKTAAGAETSSSEMLSREEEETGAVNRGSGSGGGGGSWEVGRWCLEAEREVSPASLSTFSSL